MRVHPLAAAALLLAGQASCALAQTDSLLDLDLDALSRVEVRSATGFKMAARDAPAVVSVVSASQIEALGAWTLEEALKGVAGLHISPKHRQPLFVIRGMYTFDNPQVLLTLNDIPINQPFNGALGAGVRLPLAAVERIEVVRGPGSALFGADAFAGVINIVTRAPLHEPETMAGASLGDFESAGVWARKTTRLADWGLMLSAETRRSRGDAGRRISADQQTAFDALFGSRASLAPGALDTQYRLSSLHAELARPELQLRLWHYRASGIGSAWGAGGALAPDDSAAARQTVADLRWQLPGNTETLRSQLNASWMNYWFDASYRVFPRGALLPVNDGGDLFGAGPSRLLRFDDGAIGQPGSDEHSYRLEWELHYSGREGQRWRLALGTGLQRFEAWERKNFSNGGAPGVLRDVGGTPFVYAPDLERRFRYASLQNVWRLSPAAELTLGLRADHYSDFGSTINPRVSLVWHYSPTLSSKWLYGRAFRAPSMKEQFVAGNPINLGSTDLRPETVNTLEWQLDWTLARSFSARLTLFHYRMKELIRLVSGSYRNVGTLKGPGLELELDWRLSDRRRLGLSYGLQHARDAQGQPAQLAPRQLLQLSAEQRLGEAWRAQAQARWVGERPREPGSNRPPLPSYALLDLGLRWQPPGQTWTWGLGLRNALDARAAEPLNAAAIPEDAPVPGREWRLDLRMAF